VESISARTHGEAERLRGSLVVQSWPGGIGDRSERAALGWVKRWRPRGPRLEPLVCDCAGGRCPVCN
jgi:hypothetical protein